MPERTARSHARARLRVACALLSLLIAALGTAAGPGSAVAASPPRLVKDIDRNTYGSKPGYPAQFNGALYFLVHGEFQHRHHQLWRSDGTTAGTTLINEFASEVGGLVPGGGLLWFGGLGGLWTSDGTTAGTTLIKEFPSAIEGFTFADGMLWFTGAGGLWTSDGTPEGTVLIKALTIVRIAGFVGDLMYLTATAADGRYLFWTSDGTSDGTTPLLPTGADPSFHAGYLAGSVGDRAILSAVDDAHGYEPWSSDGTADGTTLLIDANPGPGDGFRFGWAATLASHPFIEVFNGTDHLLYATDGTADGTVPATPPEAGCCEDAVTMGGSFYFKSIAHLLWKSDGTPDGTVRLSDPAVLHGVADLHVVGDTLYFSARDDSHGVGLWKSDGTNVEFVADLSPGVLPYEITPTYGFVPYGRWIYFGAVRSGTYEESEIWRTDGTAEHTKVVASRATGLWQSGYGWFAVHDGALLFPAVEGPTGEELYRLEGSPPTISLVKDLENYSGGTGFTHMTGIGDRLFFHASGQPWVSDGTRAGTFRLSLAESVSASAFVRAGSLVYFMLSVDLTITLWVTDGTRHGTHPLHTVDSNPASLDHTDVMAADSGSTLYFASRDDATGVELWSTKGTVATTHRVADINHGPASSDSADLTWAAGQDSLYFSAKSMAGGRELWRTRGTPASTKQVADIVSGSHGSWPGEITPAGPLVLFAANAADGDRELYRSDGTAQGTARVVNLDRDRSSDPHDLVPMGSRVLFTGPSQSNRDGEAYLEALWSTDGTRAGTQQLRELGWSEETFRPPAGVAVVGSTAYFFVADRQLWRTDGTPANTMLLRDLGTDNIGRNLAVVGDVVYFATDCGPYAENGTCPDGVLWTSDGTHVGTRLVATGLTNVDPIAGVGTRLFFGGTDPHYGHELRVIDP